MPEAAIAGSPKVVDMRVIPVAGQDSMLLNLSGAHGPYFTRNVVLLSDNAGNTGLGEVPGGERIRQTLEDSIPLVVGQPIGNYRAILNESEPASPTAMPAAAVCRPSTCAQRSTPSPQSKLRCLTSSDSSWSCRSRRCLVTVSSAIQ